MKPGFIFRRAMPGIISALVLAGTVVTAGPAQEKPAPAPGLAGKWTASVETPHGKMAVGFEFKVDGKKVVGTFTTDHRGPLPLTGQYADGRLTFKVTDTDLTFAGRLKDADTLTGVLSNADGDLAATATRVKSKGV